VLHQTPWLYKLQITSSKLQIIDPNGTIDLKWEQTGPSAWLKIRLFPFVPFGFISSVYLGFGAWNLELAQRGPPVWLRLVRVGVTAEKR